MFDSEKEGYVRFHVVYVNFWFRLYIIMCVLLRDILNL